MTLKGIVDLGSNSVRLVIYEIRHKAIDEWKDDGQPKAKKNRLFQDIVNEKKIAGLSAYVKKHELSREGMDVAIDVLRNHLNTAHNVGCNDVYIFATAFLRNCRNSNEAIKTISHAIDHKIDLLSDKDEAHLGFVGASCNRDIKDGTLIDIGGGSTELTSIEKSKDQAKVSLPQGSVSSYAEYVSLILPDAKEIKAIKTAFKEKLLKVKGLEAFQAEHLYGIGGSLRAVNKLYAAAFANEEKPESLSKPQIYALRDFVLRFPSDFAHAATKVAPERLHSIVPGMAIAITLIDTLEASDLSVCKYGVREGYLLERVLKV